MNKYQTLVEPDTEIFTLTKEYKTANLASDSCLNVNWDNVLEVHHIWLVVLHLRNKK